jgi:hypothetical protein
MFQCDQDVGASFLQRVQDRLSRFERPRIECAKRHVS